MEWRRKARIIGLTGLLVSTCAPAGAVPAGGREDTAIIFTQMPVTTDGAGSTEGFAFRVDPPDGSRIVMLRPARPDGGLEILTEGFASACDPCVSFDASRFLFAAKERVDDDWNIWEMAFDGSGKRRLTDGLGDCREPAYLARSSITPPEFTDKVRWIVFTSTAAGTYDESGSDVATALWVTNLEPIEGRGVVRWRTTFNLSHDFAPTVLSDGRVLFSSWQQHSGRFPPQGMIALMTVNWAGTGLNLFYGNHRGLAVKTMACEMPGRTVVFVESDGEGYGGSGQLARVSLKRPLRSHETLSNGIGRYCTPHPHPDGGLVVSYAARERSFGLHFFNYDDGAPGAEIYDDPAWDEIDAIAVTPRDEPQGRITIVVDSQSTGHLQCLNVYDSDRPEAAGIQKGDVKRVRFIEGVPNAGWRILGEAPVEPDGSFHVELPADTPFFIQTLDADGVPLQTMRAWMWVRRGSRRGCIGCHENKELAPENRTTDALRKLEVHSLIAPPEERRWLDLRHDADGIGE